MFLQTFYIHKLLNNHRICAFYIKYNKLLQNYNLYDIKKNIWHCVTLILKIKEII